MLQNLPTRSEDVRDWPWENFQPFFDELATRELNDQTAHEWLTDFSQLYDLIGEVYIKLEVSQTQNTADSENEARLNKFLDTIYPRAMEMVNVMNKKIIASKIEPEGFGAVLRNLVGDVELFRDENLPLISENEKLGTEYDKIIGAQTLEWEGKEITISQTTPILQDTDRAIREKVWRLARERQLQDRAALNELYARCLDLRDKMAKNAGFPHYMAYRWKQFHRFDYTPADVENFRNSIEQVVVPAATRIIEKRRQQLGVDTFRPWDETADPSGLPPLRPYKTIDELNAKTSAIFHQVDPELGRYYDIMREADMLDLENRKNKAPGGYNTSFPVQKMPFIFMNAVGIHDNVQTLLHEGGHAFHAFETNDLPYTHQREYPIEMAEVASMSMELIAMPYLTTDHGGYYTPQEAARAMTEHLEGMILFWPYMSVVDAFQTWTAQNVEAAKDPANCDAKWGEIWDRFIPAIDYSGLEDIKVTGWHRKQHIYRNAFYYVEYGLAQLGAAQVWANSLEDQAQAIKDYRKALALGGTETLPNLFAAAGAKLAFDAETLGRSVSLIERRLEELEQV